MNDKKSFWTTLPGILTGLAGLITAIGGLIVVLYSQGLIGPRDPRDHKPGREVISQPEKPSPTTPSGPSKPSEPGSPAGFRVVEVFLRADPLKHVGPCPVTISFSGRISVAGGDGTVSFKFLRSDGASAPVQTLSFDSPGSKDVRSTWRLGGPGFTFSGWEALKIFDPQEIESDRATFTISCQEREEQQFDSNLMLHFRERRRLSGDDLFLTELEIRDAMRKTLIDRGYSPNEAERITDQEISRLEELARELRIIP